ncbi:MAG TPA: hypothetical protein VF240_00455 [Pyrinomonadaceae bacterium]
MSATRQARYSEVRRPQGAPDLNHFRRRYPLTVAALGALPEREAWLGRIWEEEARWRESSRVVGVAAEVIVRGGPPAGSEVEGEFEVVCAGGGLGLLYAAVLGARHGRRVLVFDEGEVGRAARVWNVSGEDLTGLERAGLFTREEIEGAVANRRRAGFVKFHDAASRVKAERLWVEGVLDVALDADRLLQLASARLRARRGCATRDRLRFVRAYVEPQRVTVETEDARGRRQLFAARLFIDATGAASPVARQINDGRAPTHVCPTVGTIARGYSRGDAPDAVDFSVGELLVSTEDASQHRQLVWGGFAGAPAVDEFTSHLFFYDATESPADKSLLELFENYFERLPAYKRRGAHWRVRRPLFGYVPGWRRQGWRGARSKTADERVLLVGRGAGSPLSFGAAGAHLRDLGSVTHLVHLALEADLLDARSLAEVCAQGPRPAPAADLADFLRPTPRSAPASVNETLNAVMAALHHLDECVRRELFLGRASFGTLKNIFGHTAKLYPRIFARAREHLGARGTVLWLAGLAESAIASRRGRAGAGAPGGDEEEGRQRDAAQEFARHLALYKKGRGAEL